MLSLPVRTYPCHNDDHPTKNILNFQSLAAGWRRVRDVPHTRWLDVVNFDLEGCGARPRRAQQLAEDRRMVEIGGASLLYARSARDLSQLYTLLCGTRHLRYCGN